MARVKVARDRALDLAARCKSAKNRPVCPSCGRRMPGPGESRDDWLLPHGHRRPDGIVCPGFRKRPSIAPPPPMAKPSPKWVDPALPPTQTMPVDEWAAWFDEQCSSNAQLWTPPPRVEKRRHVGDTSAQISLFSEPEPEPQRRYAVTESVERKRLQTG